MRDIKALDFLRRHSMAPEGIDVLAEAEKMAQDMERGLSGRGGSMPMIPTYLRIEGEIAPGRPVAVIDAGGTNFRCALVSFEDGGWRVEGLKKASMPGIGSPATWEEFISFTADNIQGFMSRARAVGFCFSYSADITPETDGRVRRIDKEVRIENSSGKLVCASLLEELDRRGLKTGRAVLLNDTAAVLLGASAALDKSRYDGFIGQVSGTGTNTCCALPLDRIGKLGRAGEESIIINLESGMYSGMPRGDFDLALDRESGNPGLKLFEKLTAGVYLGELARITLLAAGEEGHLSPACREGLAALDRLDSSKADAWACGQELDELCSGEEDRIFVQAVCRALFERSARCMCVNLLALLRLTGGGLGEKPALICAEGSLVQKGRVYRPALKALLEEYGRMKMGRKFEYIIGEETTLPGSAAAALLNT